MRQGDDAFEALRAAIDRLAAEQAPELVAEARAEAWAKVRSMLAEAMAQALLDHTGAALADQAGTRAPDPSGSATPADPAPPGDAPAAGRPGRPTGLEGRDDAGAEGLPDEPAVQPASADALGCYVYCVARAGGIDLPDDLPGVEPSQPVTVVAEGEIAAVTSAVSLAQFGEDALRENLNDLGWLEARARAHERVLDAALAEATVIPMRLCTIYGSEAGLREMLRRQAPVFEDALDRLEGKSEWGVKVFVERNTLQRAAEERSEELAALRAEMAEMPEGEAYMKRRRLDALAREEADRLADDCADATHVRLSARVSEALLNPLQRPEVSGHSGDMLLNGVYLVDNEAVDGFRAAVDELQDEYGDHGFHFELTGPWPPYNFVKSSIEAAR